MSGILSKRGSPDGGGTYDGWSLSYNQEGTVIFDHTDSIMMSSVSALSLNTWHHIAVIKHYIDPAILYIVPPNNIAMYVDGVRVSGMNDSKKYSTANAVRIGQGYSDKLGYSHTGYMQDIRFSASERWTTSFIPNTALHQCDANTTLLIQSNTTDGSTTFVDSCSALDPIRTSSIFDNKIKNITTTDYVDANVTVSEATSPFPGGTQAFYFPGGTNNSLQYNPISESNIAFGSDNFYMTMWVKPDGDQHENGATILADWDGTDSTNNSFIIYMDSEGYVIVRLMFAGTGGMLGPNTLNSRGEVGGTGRAGWYDNDGHFRSPVKINDGKWHHIAVDRGPIQTQSAIHGTNDGFDDTLKLFVDGVLMYWLHLSEPGSPEPTRPTLQVSNKALTIGDFDGSLQLASEPREWKGWIDDIKICIGDTIYKPPVQYQQSGGSVIRLTSPETFNVPTEYSTNLTQWIDPSDTNAYAKPNWTFTVQAEVCVLVQANNNTVTVSVPPSGVAVVGSNTYPKGSKLYYVRKIDTPDIEEWGESFVAPMKTRIGEVYYGHNVSLSGILDVQNINEWKYFFSSFYSYTHANEIRGTWLHDSNWSEDIQYDSSSDGIFSLYPAMTGAPLQEVSAGWGYLRYGGYDHRQYGEGWETDHIRVWSSDEGTSGPGYGSILPASAIGF